MSDKKIIACYSIYNDHGWRYVGATSDLQKRLLAHRNVLHNGTHSNENFQIAYDVSNEGWQLHYVEFDTIDEAYEKEVELIRKYRPTGNLFNVAAGGYRTNPTAYLDDIKRDKMRKKISESAKSRKMSDETKRKLSIINKGKIISEEHKLKNSLAMANKTPEENLEIAMKMALGRKNKSVIVMGIKYLCPAEAVFHTGIRRSTIEGRCLSNNYNDYAYIAHDPSLGISI